MQDAALGFVESRPREGRVGGGDVVKSFKRSQASIAKYPTSCISFDLGKRLLTQCHIDILNTVKTSLSHNG